MPSLFHQRGILLDVVSELKKTVGRLDENIIIKFLTYHNLRRFFRFLITPLGKIDLRTGGVIDDRYVGRTKREGSIYDILVLDLAEQGISPDEALMIGDLPATDVDPARQRGLHALQYCGYADLGPSTAVARIWHFSELLHQVRRDGTGLR